MCSYEKHQSALRVSNSDSNSLLFCFTSDMFISSISARVGAFSRMRGRAGGRGPLSDTDRSMHEVDLTLQGQVWARQGREPNAGGRETKTLSGRKYMSGEQWDQCMCASVTTDKGLIMTNRSSYTSIVRHRVKLAAGFLLMTKNTGCFYEPTTMSLLCFSIIQGYWFLFLRSTNKLFSLNHILAFGSNNNKIAQLCTVPKVTFQTQWTGRTRGQKHSCK